MLLYLWAMLLGVNADRRTVLPPRLRAKMSRVVHLEQGSPDSQRLRVAPSFASHRQAVLRPFCTAPSNSLSPSCFSRHEEFLPLIQTRRLKDGDTL